MTGDVSTGLVPAKMTPFNWPHLFSNDAGDCPSRDPTLEHRVYASAGALRLPPQTTGSQQTLLVENSPLDHPFFLRWASQIAAGLRNVANINASFTVILQMCESHQTHPK